MQDNIEVGESISMVIREKGKAPKVHEAGLRAVITIDGSTDEFDPSITINVEGNDGRYTFPEALASVFLAQFVPQYGNLIKRQMLERRV